MTNKKPDDPIPTLILEDRQTGERKVATIESLQKVLAELGLEIVPLGEVNWSEPPDSAYMKAQIARLESAIRELHKKRPN